MQEWSEWESISKQWQSGAISNFHYCEHVCICICIRSTKTIVYMYLLNSTDQCAYTVSCSLCLHGIMQSVLTRYHAVCAYTVSCSSCLHGIMQFVLTRYHAVCAYTVSCSLCLRGIMQFLSDIFIMVHSSVCLHMRKF
jgi:hypothetical protein